LGPCTPDYILQVRQASARFLFLSTFDEALADRSVEAWIGSSFPVWRLVLLQVIRLDGVVREMPLLRRRLDLLDQIIDRQVQ